MQLKRPLFGGEKGTDVRAIQRALNAAPSQTVIKVTSTYDVTTVGRVVAFQKAHDIKPTGFFGQGTLDELWPFFDAYGRLLYRRFQVPSQVPDIGSVTFRGPSLLDQIPTHDSSGVPLFVATDLAFSANGDVMMFSPEKMRVDTKDSHARPGEAFYATGLESKLRYWWAHGDRDIPLGTVFARGDFVWETVDTDIGGGPHGHIGINGEAYLGAGKQFLYGRTGTGPDYSWGSPSYRQQLERALL